ncbi:MAG: BBP7 family outer membrane beta-barrel protein, partial [Gemmataceae bacterium]|nr:BBP7 family outer membrane beta-barrel protein [Gemmataceae bacterium]
IPGNAGFSPAPAIMPPGNFGPEYDPLGLGPPGGFGPPPGPTYPVPGPYAQQSWQPSPPMPRGGAGDLNYNTAPRWWVDGEYLLWFTGGQPLRSALLTTSAPSDAGILGRGSTTVLVGDRDLGYNAMSGFRLGTGFFGDADRRFGFDFHTWVIERAANTQTFGGAQNNFGIPVLARPFVDAATGAQSTIVLSTADFGPANVIVGTNTQTFAIQPSAVWNVYRSEPGSRLGCSIDFLLGYQFLQVKENLFVQTQTFLNGQFLVPTFTTGPFGVITQTGVTATNASTQVAGVNVFGPSATIGTRDSFRTTNRFNGVSLGLRGETRYGIFTTSLFGRISLGNMHERLEVFGATTITDPSGVSGSAQPNQNQLTPTTGTLTTVRTQGGAYGGVLANNANIGTFTRDRFSYIPEFGGNVGVALTKGLTGYVGVTVVYVPDVIRPGNQISNTLNSAAIPFSANYGAAGAVPTSTVAPAFRQSEFWIGGVNFGLQFRY